LWKYLNKINVWHFSALFADCLVWCLTFACFIQSYYYCLLTLFHSSNIEFGVMLLFFCVYNDGVDNDKEENSSSNSSLPRTRYITVYIDEKNDFLDNWLNSGQCKTSFMKKYFFIFLLVLKNNSEHEQSSNNDTSVRNKSSSIK
jgi:hypothetical protein